MAKLQRRAIKKGALLSVQERTRKMCLRVCLELEAHGELDLTFAEERAVSPGHAAESARAAIKVQVRAGDRVQRGVHGCDLRAVEEVKCLSQHFYLRFLGDSKTT